MIAERFAVVSLMTVEEARSCVHAINGHMQSARARLLDLYERRGWEVLGYASWRACVVAEFDQSQQYLYRQLQAAEIEQRISPMGEIGAIPERQLRPLASLTPMEQPIAWQEVNERTNGAPTAYAVDQVAREMRGDWIAPETISEKRGAMFNDGMKSSDSAEWYTPDLILDPVRAVFGTIDTDPCSHEDAQRTVQAARYYTEADDGLIQPWEGNAFVNPPYGDVIARWVPRLIEAYTTGECRSVIALVPGRTETDWFAPLLVYPMCFVHGRLKFSGSKVSAPFPSVVVYLGSDLERFADAFAPLGPIMVPWR